MEKDIKKSFRVSKKEETLIVKKAQLSNMTFSAYVRLAALEHQVIVIPGIKKLYLQVAKVGNNLNQLTMLCHQGVIKAPELEETKDMLWQVQLQLETILKEVKKNSSY